MVDAKINFGAAKLTVYGKTSLENLHEAGAFDKLTIFPEKEQPPVAVKVPFWKRYGLLGLSVLFLFAGYIFSENILFGAAILLGGFPLFKTGLKNLIRLDFDMKTLMTVAIIGAAIIGEWSEGAVVVLLQGQVYL